jgi:hypothetical protein
MDETVTQKNEERKDNPLSFTVGTPGTRIWNLTCTSYQIMITSINPLKYL